MSAAGGVPRFRANVVATLIGRLGSMAVALVFATLLSRWIGLARYGTWSVYAAFLGFSSVLDFGLVVAVERAVAHAHATGDVGRVPALVHAARSLALLLAAGLFAIALGAALAIPASGWRALGDPVEARRAALVLPIAFALNLQAAVWAAALTGLRRSAEAHLLRVGGTALAAALVLGLVWHIPLAVPGMLIAYAVVIFVTGGAVAWRVKALIDAPWSRWPGRWDVAAVRTLAGVGSTVQASTLAAQAGDLAFRSMLGARFGAAAIGAYDLATRAAMAPRTAASAVPVALVPQAQAQAVSEGPGSLAALHARSVVLVALVVVGAAAGAWLLVSPLLALWLGTRPELGDVATLVRVLLIFHAVLAIGAVASAIGRALGRPGPEAIAAVAGNAAGVAAAGLTGSREGAVTAFATIVAASAVVQAVWIARREGLRWPNSTDALRILGVGAAAFAGAWVASRLDAPMPLHLAFALAASGTTALLAALALGVFRAGRLAPAPSADSASLVDGR